MVGLGCGWVKRNRIRAPYVKGVRAARPLRPAESIGCFVDSLLVQPTDAERVLNGKPTEYRLKAHRAIDWKPQFEKAIEAFERNGYFILIDDKQAESLDQEFV